MTSIIDKYTQDQLKQIVQQSNSYNEVLKKLGYTSKGSNKETIEQRIKKYNIDISHFNTDLNNGHTTRNEKNVFINNSTASQTTLRRWYLKGEYTPYVCSICGLEPVWQGKDLTLILDHINGSNHDNRLENLRWVCPNCNQQLQTTGFKKMRVEQCNNKRKIFYCIDCRKEISNNATRCQQCYKKQLQATKPITREELKDLIRNEPFTHIGAKFGVTDNAIKKWCDKFNLPRTKRDINKISDEEWEKI